MLLNIRDRIGFCILFYDIQDKALQAQNVIWSSSSSNK